MVRVVLGEGVSFGAGVCEGFRSRGGDVARPVGVEAAVSRGACEGVGSLAEVVQVSNRAAGTPTKRTIGRASSRNLSGVDLQRQVVGVHIAQVVGILAIGADGELSQICLRLGIVSYSGISIATWESPNQTSRPGSTHVEKMGVTVVEYVASDSGALSLITSRKGRRRRALAPDIDRGALNRAAEC